MIRCMMQLQCVIHFLEIWKNTPRGEKHYNFRQPLFHQLVHQMDMKVALQMKVGIILVVHLIPKLHMNIMKELSVKTSV